MPNEEWIGLYRTLRERTACPVDLDDYFSCGEVCGMRMDVMDIGECSLPTGRLMVRDPIAYLRDRKERPYLDTAPAGTYRTEVAVVLPEDDCARYAAVRVRFDDGEPVRFYEALVGYENLVKFEDGDYFGFNVDSGLACICDEEVHEAFCDWLEDWEFDNPGADLYDDYFADLFEESYADAPEHQREGGDWINWCVPGTDYRLPMFQTGFGDGAYPAYWGYDRDGRICQLVVQFIDIEMTYDED